MNDLISRQAVLGYIDRVMTIGTGKKKSLDFVRKYTEALPSAQSEIIHCRECQHWKQGELVDKCGLLDCYADADCYCAWAVRERRQDDGCSQVSERKESDV